MILKSEDSVDVLFSGLKISFFRAISLVINNDSREAEMIKKQRKSLLIELIAFLNIEGARVKRDFFHSFHSLERANFNDTKRVLEKCYALLKLVSGFIYIPPTPSLAASLDNDIT